MLSNQNITSTHNLPEFRYLELCDSANWVDLVISSGEKEMLTIQGPEKLVNRIETRVNDGTLIISVKGSLVDKIKDALTTSLTRKKITYHLSVRQLEGMDLCGLIRLDTNGLKSKSPIINHLNPMDIRVKIPVPRI
jgi:hypothetical protein